MTIVRLKNLNIDNETLIALCVYSRMYVRMGCLLSVGEASSIRGTLTVGFTGFVVYSAGYYSNRLVSSKSCTHLCASRSSAAYQLFTDTAKYDVEWKQLWRFVERYALELDMASQNPQEILRMDRVQLSRCHERQTNMYLIPTSFNQYELTCSDEKISLTLLNEQMPISRMLIPRQYALITGMTKRELDNSLFCCNDVVDTTLFPLNKTDNPLDEYVHPEIAQLMLFGSNANHRLALTTCRYDGCTNDTIALNDWMRMAIQEGCVPIWGEVEQCGDYLKAIYVWRNEKYGYLHHFRVEFPYISAANPNYPIKATLYPYVPYDHTTMNESEIRLYHHLQRSK